jgi:hypothetical protein
MFHVKHRGSGDLSFSKSWSKPVFVKVSRETLSYEASVWRRVVRLVIILCENLEISGKALLAVLFCLAFVVFGQKSRAGLSAVPDSIQRGLENVERGKSLAGDRACG